MLDMITRVFPFIILIALALFVVLRIALRTTGKGRTGNPPGDSGNSRDARDHLHHGSTSSSHPDIPPPPAHH